MVNNATLPPRIHKSAAQRHTDILKAAAEVFAKEGYRGTDVERVAEKAGVGKGTVYRQFANKEALFLATVEKAMEDLCAYVNNTVADTGDPLEQIRTAVHRFFEFFDAHPGTVELFIQERAEFSGRSKPLYLVYQARHRQAWLERFEALVRDGRLSGIQPELALDTISALVYGAIFSHRRAGDDEPLAEQSEAIVEIVFNGILGIA